MDDIDVKSWLTSKGVWGGLIAVAAAILSLFGFHIGADLQGDIVDWAVGLGGLVGGALAIYGRVKASKRIG